VAGSAALPGDTLIPDIGQRHRESDGPAMSSGVPRSYRPEIDGLRAVAVLSVVLFHAGLPFTSGGYVGVDVFFVISGFLITGILTDDLARGRFSLIGFYERRARRILPALIAVILASFVAGWLLLMPDRLVDLAGSAIATALFSSNVWFWQNTGGYFHDAAEYEPLLHT
jgi:peptidoglycan/LPS O-acetylase OafA/YrhL